MWPTAVVAYVTVQRFPRWTAKIK